MWSKARNSSEYLALVFLTVCFYFKILLKPPNPKKALLNVFLSENEWPVCVRRNILLL